MHERHAPLLLLGHGEFGLGIDLERRVDAREPALHMVETAALQARN